MNTFPTILFFFTLYTPDRIVGSPKPENDVHFHINLGDNVQKQKLPTKETGEDYMERKSFRTSTPTPKSDVKQIIISNKAGDYSDEPVKQIILDGKRKEVAEVRPRPSVLSRDLKISKCSKHGCEERRLSREQRIKLERCNFEGSLLSDPDSKVSLVACRGDDVNDIQVISDHTTLENNAYRVNSDGTVSVSNTTIDSDENPFEEENIGQDYALPRYVYLPFDRAYVNRQKKKLKVKTIELGVYTDVALSKQIQESIGNADSEAISNKITECINAIFMKVENLFRHNSFSSLKGGFRVSVKKIFILEEDDEMAKKLNKINTLYQILKKFTDMADELNREGEENFDARIFLTGRDSTSLDNISSGSVKGWAQTGRICDIWGVAVSTVKIEENGHASTITSDLIAHEIAHLLGSVHDGGKGYKAFPWFHSSSEPRYNNKEIPCPPDQHLMSPTLHGATWSKCTRHQIDEFDEVRVELGLDCLLRS